jgi:GTP-binding protein EngB required for normal cell division
VTEPIETPNSLNASQKLHLMARCQYADKLLSDVESILAAAESKSPFLKYKQDISATQAKVVRDYIARIRAQVIRALESQGMEPSEPQFGALHSVRVTLAFAGIALDECGARYMRGYGDVPEPIIPELNGLVDELKGLIARLDSYLAQGLGQNLQARLEKLRPANGVSLVKTLERVINTHGLVEFRPALANIVDRLESTNFEIAFFGRVSSGKSSLLNRIVQKDVLPVGVTPVTAVPTRIIYAPADGAMAWFADRRAERFELGRLAEFCTEQHNASNWKRVTRLVVELPSARLRDGVVYVDTPGLGSLAKAGSAETLAYLPRCDLGVVLIDAGATLSAEDLGTIRALYEATVPAMVLLSKSDLLAPDDQQRVRQYVSGHIASELGLNLPVHVVSAKPEYLELLENWFNQEILPLYDRHVTLARDSLDRKIGALRVGVESALRSKLRGSSSCDTADHSRFRALEKDLRMVGGRFAEIRAKALSMTDEIREAGDAALRHAASAFVDSWTRDGASAADAIRIVTLAVEDFGGEMTRPIVMSLQEVAAISTEVLARTAAELSLESAPDPNELQAALRDMPRPDLGNFNFGIRPNRLAAAFGLAAARRDAESKLRSQIGDQLSAAFSGYGKQLESWVRRTTADLQARFDSHADAYRAHLDRLLNQEQLTPEDQGTIERDLTELTAGMRTQTAAEAPRAG